MIRRSILSGLAALFLGATPAAAADDPGAVYALSNAASGNAVFVYERAGDGMFSYAGAYGTGGLGAGGGLGSQGAVTLSGDGRVLLAVNAGSNSISTFAVRADGLELRDMEASGGVRPTSVAERNASCTSSMQACRTRSPASGSTRRAADADHRLDAAARRRADDAVAGRDRAVG